MPTQVAGLSQRVVPMSNATPRPILLSLLLVVTVALAGCHDIGNAADELDRSSKVSGSSSAGKSYASMGWDGETWPRLDGVTLTILDHGAFAAFDDLAPVFENLTGAKVVHVEADDTGSALNRAILERGDPSFDVIYGIDNLLYAQAVTQGIFEPYEPLLANQIDSDYVFFDESASDAWYATPVDHGYIGLNIDTDHPSLDNADIRTLDDVAKRAKNFVTQDPRTSTPGLGYLIATVATYGETGERTWQDHWTELFEGGVLVTSGWSEAYMQHFTAAGEWVGESARDRAIVTSYTESPAYEAYFGMNTTQLAKPFTAPKSTFHQIQTMGIARGTDNLAAAQAWIEFSLTDDFQTTAASYNAVYPVTTTEAALASVADTYGDHDPEPGTFTTAGFDHKELGANVERWIEEWVELCEKHDCA